MLHHADMIRADELSGIQSDLAAQAALYRLIVESAIDLIIRYDRHGIRTYVSPSSREVLGYEPWEMMGKNSAQLVHPDDFTWADPLFRALGPHKPTLDLTFRAVRKDGRTIWVEAKHRYLLEDGGGLAVIRDITVRKEAEQMLQQAHDKLESANQVLHSLAQQDGLTGLANRRRFDELLDEEFRRARRHELPLGVVLADVDCFKAYNDRYGHLAGDDCLRRVGKGIEAVLRRPGDHVARYGGEEFVVLLSATDSEGARMVAERIRKSILALALEHGGSPHGLVTVSAGTSALIPFEGDRSAELVGAADRALYIAKSAGRNCVRADTALVFAETREAR